MGIPQMRVLIAPGHVEDVFPTNNDGFVGTLSPDGIHLAFTRYEWDVSANDSQSRLWLANLQTGQQWPVGTWAKTAGGLWSPDSQLMLIHQLDSIEPLWAGYNYGHLSVYSLTDDSLTPLDNTWAFAQGWYADSQNLLLWNESDGYLTYSLETKSVRPAQFQPPVTGPVRWTDVYSVSEESIIAIPSVDYQLLIYSLDSGFLLQRIIPEEGDFVSRPSWSPDGQFLAIELSGNDILIWDYQSREILSSITNPVNETPVGYYYEIYWTTSPQQLFIIIRTSLGIEIHMVELFSAELSLVYQTK
jgi:Tol biopolymer transport system component